MGVLLDLPDEVLSDMFDMVEVKWDDVVLTPDMRSLTALARTSRRLNRLASRILLKDIGLDVATNEEEKGSYRVASTYDMLMRTLQGNPDLASLVRHVTLIWRGPRGGSAKTPKNDKGLGNKKSNDLLALLPTIETLDIYTHHNCLPFSPDFLAQNSAPKLRQLNIPYIGVSYNAMVRYLKISGLDDLSVDYLGGIDRLPPEVITSRANEPRLALSRLHLGTSHRRISELSMLFGLISGIKELAMGTPAQDAEGQPTRIDRRLPQSPKGIERLLRPFSSSLVNLRLWDHDSIRGHSSHDGSRMNLSGFEVLTKLEILASLIFDADSADSARDGVWRLLPPRLESLKLWFNAQEHFIYTPDELRTAFTETGQFDAELVSIPVGRYNWLQEIVECKLSNFPSLTEVRIEEKRAQMWVAKATPSKKVALWKVPASLERRYAEAGIYLRAILQVPKDRPREG